MDTSHSSRMTLPEFRRHLRRLMPKGDLRPFVCEGSPLACRVFIVGFNPATQMDKPFWRFWSNTSGFNKARFMEEYCKKRNLRKLKGVRARIQCIANGLGVGLALETNICSRATRTADELRKDDRTTDVFRFLLETIKPELVYLHSNEPIKYFQELTGKSSFEDNQICRVEYNGHHFGVMVNSGPLFRMSYANATNVGCAIRRALERGVR